MTYEFFDIEGRKLSHSTLATALTDRHLYRVAVTNSLGTHEYINTGAGWKDILEAY